MLERIARDDDRGEYIQIAETGDYRTAGAEDRVAATYAALMRPTLPELQFGSSSQ